jgi:UDP-N-acetylmuramate--alanine ligase
MDIYSAGEDNPNNISSYDFVNSLLKKNLEVFHGKNLTEISKLLEENISDNEILITQGAGNVADISNSLVAMYK